MTISQAQKANTSTIAASGSDEFERVEVRTVFEAFGKQFMLNLAKNIKAKDVVASGHLASFSDFAVSEDGKTLNIEMPSYYDYPNEGVKGVKSSNNAPGSPYKFKTYGMPSSARKSIANLIATGKMSIKNVRNDKAFGIGKESKYKTLAESQAASVIYNIKKYGIKATNYFNITMSETLSEFQPLLIEAFGKDVTINITREYDNN